VSKLEAYQSCHQCARCGRIGEQVWVDYSQRWCQVCRNISNETIRFFAEQIAFAREVAGLPSEQLAGLRAQLLPLLSEVVRRYEEDPVQAGLACDEWLRTLDRPELMVTVRAADLLPSYCLRPDVAYLRARALTQLDEQGAPMPIPGVAFV
jgi:hypothetical protein